MRLLLNNYLINAPPDLGAQVQVFPKSRIFEPSLAHGANSFTNVVFYAMQSYVRAIQCCKSRTGIAVSGLADRAGVAVRLAVDHRQYLNMCVT